MGLLDGLFEARTRHVGVDLRRCDIGVAKQGLDASQIGATLHEMRSESVAEHMGRKPRRIETCFRRESLKQLMASPARQMRLSSARREEEAGTQ